MRYTHYMILKFCWILFVQLIVIFNKIYVTDSKNSETDGITVNFNLHVIGFNFNLQHVDVV